jgi:hypothetical protein
MSHAPPARARAPVSHRAASRDLLVAPLFQGIAAPLGMALGPEISHAAGELRTAPPGVPPEPVHLAPEAPGTYYYPLEGKPGDWQVLAEVQRRLTAIGRASGSARKDSSR